MKKLLSLSQKFSYSGFTVFGENVVPNRKLSNHDQLQKGYLESINIYYALEASLNI